MTHPNYDARDKYDVVAARGYDETRAQETHWAKEDSFVSAYFWDKRIDHLLDIPVGTGRFFRHYRLVRQLTGVDISDAMLVEAGKKVPLLPPGVRASLEQGDVFALRFADQSFDTVLVSRLFHLLPPEMLNQVARELCRVGRLIVAQTYASAPSFHRPPQNQLRRTLGKCYRRMKTLRRRPLASSIAPAPSPWSHIKAYYHSQELVDAAFSNCGYRVTHRTTVDHYMGNLVNFTVYSVL